MADIQSQNPTGTEHIETQSNDDRLKSELNSQLCELSTLEKKIFKGDGNIGGNSNDSIIDTEYNEAMKNATDIKSKIDIVRKLIDSFSSYIFYKNKVVEPYISEKSELMIKKIEGTKNRLMIKYNGLYDNQITLFIQKLINLNTYNIEYITTNYNKHGMNKNDIPLSMTQMMECSLEVLLNDRLPELEKFIDYINGNNQILSKESFLMLFMEKDTVMSGERINKVMNLDFYKNGSSYEYGFDFQTNNFFNGHGNDMINLSALTELNDDKLKQLNQLYLIFLKDGNNFDIVNFIDKNLTFEEKQTVLEVKNIRKIYTYNKINELCIRDDLIKNDRVIISLTNIKDKETLKILQYMTLGIYTKAKNDKYEKMSDFLDKDLGNILTKSSSIDKYYILTLLESIFLDPTNKKELGEKLYEEFKKKRTYIVGELWDNSYNIIDEKIKSKNFTQEQYIILEREGLIINIPGEGYSVNNNSEKIKSALMIIDSMDLSKDYTSNKKGVVEKTEKQTDKPQQTISESKRQEMQNQATKLGLKVEISEEGKMVGKDGKETVKQNIGKKSQIEVNANGELILVNSLGYKMKYENNSLGFEKSLETIETFDYMDKIGLGYFGNNLKPMLATMDKYLPSQTGYLNIDENKGDFLSMKELNEIVIPIFKNVGFIDKNQNLDYLFPEEITDTSMAQRVSLLPHGTSFSKGRSFDETVYKNVLQSTNKV